MSSPAAFYFNSGSPNLAYSATNTKLSTTSSTNLNFSSISTSTIQDTSTPALPSNKKKFGTNLNKLIKQPVPSLTVGGIHPPSSRNASARTGLLLLSTKKSSGVTNASNVGSFASGLLHAKTSAAPKPINTCSLKNEFSLSNNHVIIGSSGVIGTTTTALSIHDALVKEVDSGMLTSKQDHDSSKNLSVWQHQQHDTHSYTQEENVASHNYEVSLKSSFEVNVVKESVESIGISNRPSSLHLTLHMNQEDLTGIQYDKVGLSEKSAMVESQEDYMARLAKERTEKKKAEEEARIREQRERVARRLLELESRKNAVMNKNHDDKIRNVDSAIVSSLSHRNVNTNGEMTLEWLTRRKSVGSGAQLLKQDGRKSADDDLQVKDPTTILASSSHGPSAKLYDLNPSVAVGQNVDLSKSLAQNTLLVNTTEDKKSAESKIDGKTFTDKSTFGKTDSHLIQLSSYEDRDRGELRTSSSPRMLFDPKSGSMIAVRVRDDAGSNSLHRGKKDSKTKVALKAKKMNEKETLNTQLSFKNMQSVMKSDEMSNSSQENNDRDRGLSFQDSTDSKGDTNALIRSVQKKQDKEITLLSRQDRVLQRRLTRLPRTRGVLYRRDTDGNFLSVDECAGDQGYGAHSVPGGRFRNPSAYSEYLERQKQTKVKLVSATLEDQANYSHALFATQPVSGPKNTIMSHNEYSNKTINLTREHFMKSNSQKKVEQFTDHVDSEIPSHLKVKPNEKIELLTGIEESPTLQATAAAWAPSELALAAARLSFSNDAPSLQYYDTQREPLEHDEISESDVPVLNIVDLNGDFEEDTDEHDSPLMRGLGFDPTQNMDLMMMSPTSFRREVEGTTVENLRLSETSPVSNAFNGLAGAANFLSSTWATSGSMGSLSNWEYISTNANKTNESVSPSPIIVNAASSSSFVSLPLANTDQSGKSSSSTLNLFHHW